MSIYRHHNVSDGERGEALVAIQSVNKAWLTAVVSFCAKWISLGRETAVSCGLFWGFFVVVCFELWGVVNKFWIITEFLLVL